MVVKKEITLRPSTEKLSVVYTELILDASETAIELYDRYKISIVLSEGLHAMVGDRLISGGKNTVLFFRPDEMHFGKLTRAGMHAYLDFFIPLCFFDTMGIDASALRFLTDSSEERRNHISGLSDAVSDRKISELVKKTLDVLYSSDVTAELSLLALTFDVCAICAAYYGERGGVERERMPSAVEKTVRYIWENFSEKITLAQLARRAGCSTVYLSRLFKQYTGMTVHAYITATRIDNACIFLKRGATVTEACFASGFEDCSNFIRRFKEKVGKTPLAFRREEKEG